MMVPVMSAPMVSAVVMMRNAVQLGELFGRRGERRPGESDSTQEGNE